MANVKGSALASRVKWVQLSLGQAGLDKISAQVSPSLAETLQAGVVIARWYPLVDLIELVETIDRLFGKGDGALAHELGRYGADANLTTIYRLFFRVGTVRWVLARAARLWHMHYDVGKLVVNEAPDAIELDIADVPEPNCTHCHSVRGWAERSVELSGGENVATKLTRCRRTGGDCCTVRITWT